MNYHLFSSHPIGFPHPHFRYLHIRSDTMAQSVSDSRSTAKRKPLQAFLAQLPSYSTMTEPLRPQYFITRQNGTMVPLVALDELPATISIRGVPRTLSPYDVAGMTGLGTFESQHRQYVVDGVRPAFPLEPKAPENSFLASKHATAATHQHVGTSLGRLDLRNSNQSFTIPSTKPKAYGIEEIRSALPTNLRTNSERPAESINRPLTIEDLARNPAPGVKEYCSYWLRHGECDYAQQGCLYRHEMPLDPPTLEKLGLRDIPRWYREKHGLGSYLALSAQRAAAHGPTKSGFMERNWRNNTEFVPSPAATTSTTYRHTKNNAPSTNTAAVDDWNAFADRHTAAYNSNIRGPLHRPSPPPTTIVDSTRPAFPPLPTPTTTTTTNTPRQRPGTRLVPINTETETARVLREANEQLDAHEEAQCAKLAKYKPLVPVKIGSGTSSSSAEPGSPIIVTPEASSGSDQEDGSSISLEAVVGERAPAPAPTLKQAGTGTGTSGQREKKAAMPRNPAPAAALSVPVANGPAAASGAPRKKYGGGGGGNGGRTRAARRSPLAAVAAAAATDGVDREAQRKAVAKARAQTEEFRKAVGPKKR